MKAQLRPGPGTTVVTLCLLATAALAGEGGPLATDVLYTRNGEEYVGRLMEVTASEVVFDRAEEGLETFELSEVQRVELGKSRPGSGWRSSEDIDDPVLLQAVGMSAWADSAYPGAGYVTLYKEHAYVLHQDGSVKSTERVIRKVLLERGKRVANSALYYLSEDSKAALDFGRSVTAEGEVVPVSDAAIQDGSVYSDYPDYENLRRKNWALKGVREGAVVDYQTTVLKVRPLMPFLVDVAFGDDEPTVKEVLKVTVPKELPCSLDTVRFGGGSYAAMAQGDSMVHTWTVEHLPELIIEDSMPARADLWARAVFAPKASWEELGKAYAGVLSRHLKWDKTLKKQVKGLLRGKKTKEDKARALYEHVVKEIRTIPVPYHLYSLEPRDITQTYRKKYGNDLDKSLLFLGMLEQAGVRADLCLIRSQESGELVGIPSLGHFTDCLVRVDLKDRAVCASVTDEKVPFGSLDGEYQNVRGLLVSRKRSRLITTPLLSAKEETEERTVQASISKDGTFVVREETRYQGQSAQELRSLKAMKEEEMEKLFQRSVSAIHPNAEMVSYAVSDLNDLETPASYVLEYRIEDYALRAGESLMAFQLPDLDYSAASVGKATRVHPLDWTTRALERSRYTFAIPEGYKVYHLPASVDYEAPFMSYDAEFEQQDGEIAFSDAFERVVIEAPASAYAQYKQGIETRAQVAKEWIVLARE